MKKLSNKKMNKTFRDNLITYGMVIAAYVIMQILVSAGAVSSLLQSLLVPLCTYAILAGSLDLTVGILRELGLGHGGFAGLDVRFGLCLDGCGGGGGLFRLLRGGGAGGGS